MYEYMKSSNVTAFIMSDQFTIHYLSHLSANLMFMDGNKTTNGPRQANLVLVAYASSDGSGEPAHPRQKARSMAPLNGWACAVKICHDGMLEDTNSLDRAQMKENIIE